MAAIEAAVTERLAKIGVTVSIKAIESSGRAFRGTMIVVPGKISFFSKVLLNSLINFFYFKLNYKKFIIH